MKKSIFLFFAAILCASSAWAVNLTGGEVLYLKPNSNWTSNNAWFAMYLCDGTSSAQWVKMTKDGDYYKATVKVSATGKNHKNVIFCRMNSSNTSTLDWSNKWNQTSNLEYDGKKSMYRVKDGTWDYGDGDWACVCTEGKTIYFDTRNATDWQNPHLRIGRSDYNNSYKLEQVAGTKYLYSVTTVKWQNYEAYTIANNNGYENNHTIYQPSSEKPAYGCEITKLVNYEHSDILTDKYILASEWEKNEDDADYWKTTISNTLPSYKVSYSQTGVGTLTVTKYTGSKYEALTSGSSVQPTQIIKIETNADCKLTVTGATQIDGGNTYYVTAATTIKAEFASVAKFAGALTDWDQGALAFTTNNNTATLYLSLPRGTHEFKIIETVSDQTFWHGNDGTMARDNCTGWVFDKDNNAQIKADVEGTYKLTWDFVTNELSVTYPTFPDLSNQPNPIYFQPTEAWKSDNARFAAYFFDDETGAAVTWKNLTDDDGDGVYEVSNDKKYLAVIIVRMNPAHNTNKWENDYNWNQTADLFIPTNGDDRYTMTATGADNFDNAGVWSLVKHNISATASPVEGGSIEGANTYNYGTTATLTATANTGYEFVNWTKAGVEISTEETYSFKVTEDVDLVANFEKETYTRTVTQDNYGTICLPFGSSEYSGAEFYEVSYVIVGKGLWLDQLEDNAQLEAGKPYIFKATADQLVVVSDGKTAANPIAGANGLTGTFTDIAAGGALVDHYIIADNQVWVAGTGATLPANRAYINKDDVPTTPQAQIPGRRRVCMGENATTDIDNITNSENTTIKVIENGQLIIIRNGEKFNAQGVRF